MSLVLRLNTATHLANTTFKVVTGRSNPLCATIQKQWHCRLAVRTRKRKKFNLIRSNAATKILFFYWTKNRKGSIPFVVNTGNWRRKTVVDLIRISTAKHPYVKPGLSRAHPCSSQGGTTKLFFMVLWRNWQTHRTEWWYSEFRNHYFKIKNK